MIENEKQITVLSLGGSLIYTQYGLDIDFLKNFNKFIRGFIKKGHKFIIVCGGGKISRNYQHAVSETLGKIPNEDVDWMGIHATRMNAQLLRTIFADVCYPKVIYHYDEKEPLIGEPVAIAAGWKPGWSTDYCSTLLAKEYKAKSVVNLSNIDVVYDKDPNKYSDARPIEKISWDDFEKLVGDKWSPGANIPFDPIATKLAKKMGLSVFIVRGTNLNNLHNLLVGRPFRGTIIMPYKTGVNSFNKEYFELGIGYRGYTTTKRGRITSHLVNFYRALMIKLFLRPKSVLDVGCATGLLVFYLRKFGVDAWGLEVSEYALSKTYPSIKKYLKYGNVLGIPFDGRMFDVVTTFNVLEYVKEAQIPRALAQCERVRKKYCLHKVYTTSNKWIDWLHPEDFSRITRRPTAWWERLFAKEGFYTNPLFFPRLTKFMETIFILNKDEKATVVNAT